MNTFQIKIRQTNVEVKIYTWDRKYLRFLIFPLYFLGTILDTTPEDTLFIPSRI